jgi:hypothetical protein
MATSTVPIPIYEISFRGDGRAEASEIKAVLEKTGVTIAEPRPGLTTPGELGAAEVILTIVLSAAAKAAIEVALDHLKSYLVQRVEQKRTKLHLQVALKKEAAKRAVAREFIDLKAATTEGIFKFIGKLAEVALEHAAM